MRTWIWGLLMAAAAWGQYGMEELTHEQKVTMARRLLATGPYASEFGAPPGAELFAHLSDAQIEQEIARRDGEYQRLAAADHAASRELETYKRQLFAQGKTSPATVADYRDPTGRLQALEAKWEEGRRGLCGNELAKLDLRFELELRQHPERLIEVDQEYRKAAANNMGGAVREMAERVRRGDPVALRELGLDVPDINRMKGGVVDKSPTKVALAVPGSAKVEIRYADIYGGMDAKAIEKIEAAGMARLPAALREGVPVPLQKAFYYGGFKRMPLEAKQELGRAMGELRQAGLVSGRPMEVELGRAYEIGVAKAPKTWGVDMSKAQGVEGAAWLLVDLTQRLTSYVHDRIRAKKWAEAYRAVAAQIPAGKVETVLFIENMRRQQADVISWMECEGVHGYRGEADVRGCPAEPAEALVDLRRRGTAKYWRFQQVTKMQVRGTGAGAPQATAEEAYRTGCNMGALAAAAKLTRETMRVNYDRFNDRPETQAAFKKGWNFGNSGGMCPK